MFSVADISSLLQARAVLYEPGTAIEHILIDSRRLVSAAATLFFAIETSRRSGADFIPELYDAGVRNFVVKDGFDPTPFPSGNFVFVPDALAALHRLVEAHRQQFHIPVIGITGSNGKTVVKEWLYQLLHTDYNMVRSPKSYNSQVGVPLSVWLMQPQHDLAIFEAGISQCGEMDILQRIIRPSLGILTNIGEAHSTGFASVREKLEEKLKLFSDTELVICNTDNREIQRYITLHPKKKFFTWGYHGQNLRVTSVERSDTSSTIHAVFNNKDIAVSIPFADNASIENAISCWCVLLILGIPNDVIRSRLPLLQPVEMRLQLKRGINNCSIINDSYSNDLSSLNIALAFLQQQAGRQKATVILSDLGEKAGEVTQYAKVAAALLNHKIDKLIGIGPNIINYQILFEKIGEKHFFPGVEQFRQQLPLITFRDEVILIKGARVFEFEQIGNLFEHQVHQTVMEVNLSAMVHNLKQFHSYLKPTTKVMAMVKAFSYGSGSAEIASVLQYHKVDYLAVAYADEGVDLRKAGIQMPIMVMNPEVVTFPLLTQYNLEPEIYSLHQLSAFIGYVEREGMEQAGVHIKLNTGMNRLGFDPQDIPQLIDLLQQHRSLVVKSVFSHLVASEDARHDDFTLQQMSAFDGMTSQLASSLNCPFLRHISNSAAIFRHEALQYDMVRLGIGLYGVNTSSSKGLNLQPVATLRTTVAQLRHVKAGESIGYSRRGILEKDAKIATIRIGYADGFRRKLGNGNGYVCIKGAKAPVVGNVCMDMTMVDVTDIADVREGDTVEVFGPSLPVEIVAAKSDTIPYEILTNISLRVKRVYYQE